MGMEYSLLSEINKKSIQTYLLNLKPQLWYYPDFFPSLNVRELKYETLIGSEGQPVAADIVAYDTSAPQKTRPTISKLIGTIPAIRVMRTMTETDLNTYNQLKQLSNPAQDELLKLVFDDVKFVHKSVRGRLEWLALKILSYPALTLTRENNNGLITESAIDFQLPSANKAYVNVVWSATAATVTPITDFLAIKASAKALGITHKFALMDETQWGQFAGATETKNYTYGTLYSGAGVLLTPTLEMANKMLRARVLPEIVVIDQSITTENDNFVKTTGSPWTTDYVTFVPSLNVGNMLFAPIAEEFAPPKQVAQSKIDNILISKFSDLNPVAEYTKGETNAFVSWTKVDECFSLYVASTSAWS